MKNVSLENKYRKIVLILTQSCNLNCTYCYENHKSGRSMTFDMVKEILDNEILHIGKDNLLTVEFFGGEPFIKFEIIKNTVDYVKRKYETLHIKFATTTNGTLLTPYIKGWLADNADIFECSLSLDGTPNMHNTNRPYFDGKGSYDDIDTAFFIKTYHKPRAKMTVSKDTLPNLFDGVKYLHTLGFQPVVDLASAPDYWEQIDINIFEKQLKLLVAFYSENSHLDICRMLDYDLRRVFIEKGAPFKYCGAGRNMITFDVDGQWYPCMALAPVSQGYDAKLFKEENFKQFDLSYDNICKQCPFLRLCRNCYAANYNQTGNIEKQTHTQCYINRLTILASSVIQYNRVSKKVSNKNHISHEEDLILKAIFRIQEIARDKSRVYL